MKKAKDFLELSFEYDDPFEASCDFVRNDLEQEIGCCCNSYSVEKCDVVLCEVAEEDKHKRILRENMITEEIKRIIKGLNTCRGMCGPECSYYGRDDSQCRKLLMQDAEEMLTKLSKEDEPDCNMKYAVPVPEKNVIEIHDDLPLTVAHKLVTAIKPYEPGNSKAILSPEHKEEILVDMYSTSELREIAEYLMIYCDAHERNELLNG